MQVTSLGAVNQVRNATKKVSGSKTNKNDSAGRRLGPKAHEGNFVKPGQIIMRQRGSKIHPGENVKIGIDHTIYAVEPGYVRFYHDPFHPLRKYVGVSLKKDLNLPTPHFSPRVRRFGYELLTEPSEAKKEEDHMSRKEYTYQPKLEEALKAENELKSRITSEFEDALRNKFKLVLNQEDLKVALTRFYDIFQLVKIGKPVEDAKIQATYNFIHDLKLTERRAEISADEFLSKKAYFEKFFSSLDSQVTVDVDGSLIAYIAEEERQSERQRISKTLHSTYSNRVLSVKERKEVESLICTPGVFDLLQRYQLRTKYTPSVVPFSVPDSVIEITDVKNPPEGVIIQKIFDEAARSTRIVGRPREVFAFRK